MLQNPGKLKKSAHLLKTLGNPHRLQIILQLLGGEKNVTQINASIAVSQPALSQHLSRLRSAGILGSRREQRQIFYYLNNQHIGGLLAVMNDMGQAADSKMLPQGVTGVMNA
ncbi:MAG: metalloregulator ArsR/SmtB family transcription factor [Alphaproteobacteria bacterium]|nr:metalloregulator ArsR/SmtB family transcription factor [Alphaproteobacteria bacterium]